MLPPMSVTRYCVRCLTTFADDGANCPNLSCGAARPEEGWPTLARAGDLIDRHYRVLRVLAVGGAGVTYLAREVDPEGADMPQDLAVKVLYAARDQGSFLRRLATEAQILQDLTNDHIVHYRAFVQRAGQPACLVTLYEPGGTLSEHVRRCGPLSLPIALDVLRQVLLALDAAHSRGVVHRDLKPENVLLREATSLDVAPRIRVADFGVAKVVGGATTTIGGFVGTPEYAAPEQFLGHAPTPATDLWSCGALLCFLLTGRAPFDFSQRRDAAGTLRELRAQLPPQIRTGLDPREQSIVEGILDLTMAEDPLQRGTIEEVLGAMGSWTGSSLAMPAHRVISRPRHAPAPKPSTRPPANRGRGPAVAALSFELAPPPPPRADLSLDDLLAPRARTSLPDLGPELPSHPTITNERAEIASEPLDPPETPRRAPPRNAPPLELVEAKGPTLTGIPARAPDPWRPEAPIALPGELPREVAPLLELLGQVHPTDRHAVLTALAGLPVQTLRSAVRGHRLGGPPAIGRGVCFVVVGLGRGDLASNVRTLLGDPDPTVRICACECLGATAGGAVLASLQRLLSDKDPTVRAAAAMAVAAVCRTAGRNDLARSWLTPLAADPVPSVREAASAARASLTE